MFYLGEILESFEKDYPELFPENNPNVVNVEFGRSLYIFLKEDQEIPVKEYEGFQVEKTVVGVGNVEIEEVGDFDPISCVYEPPGV